MEAITAERRLVKSPPELWAQLSDAQELARHLGEFGEIRITRLEAERTVAWEGDLARGTVELEPSGWGTRVTLTAEPVESAPLEVPVPDPAPDSDPEPPPDPAPEPDPAPHAGPSAEPAADSRAEPEPVIGAAPTSEPEPNTAAELEPPRRQGFLARLFGRRRRAELPSDPAPNQPPLEVFPSPDLGPPSTVAGQRTLTDDPTPAPESAPEPEPIVDVPQPGEVGPGPDLRLEKTAAILETVLDDLGAAHHRPFSRG
jgi:hypothetical protein